MAEYRIVVKPGSKKGPLVETGTDGILTVYVRERAIEGQANDAIIALLAKYFDTAKTRIKIIRGHTARIKTIQVD
jgi:uncharacterized protein